MMFLFLFVALIALSVADNAFPSMIGSFEGNADWYEFTTNPGSEYGSDIINYKQLTRLSFTEQEGPFFRGQEYYKDDSKPNGWAFVASLYGIMTKQQHQLGDEVIYSVRFSEYLNQNKTVIESSLETIGSFSGTLATSTAATKPFSMNVAYTGNTSDQKKYGAQHMVLTKSEN